MMNLGPEMRVADVGIDRLARSEKNL